VGGCCSLLFSRLTECGGGAGDSGVETRTSAPVCIERGRDYECVSLKRMYPCGEGAGYAGGIVSAAVDGLAIGQHIAMQVLGASVDPVSTGEDHSKETITVN
jgi:hypothetical protein